MTDGGWAVLPQETIRAKRDRRELDGAEIAAFMAGLADGRVAPAQGAAFAMAVFLNGMSLPECVALTRAMTASGSTLDWSGVGLDGPVLDKHSTGGIGDTVSLMLAPLVAACGGYVPMISGRGLGHTGGTLDKLDAIEGYRSQPDLDLFRRTVREAGCAIIGQTDSLAPADRTLYAIRDVTATVESIPLITASILSKKLAAGLGALVMDVKTGSGAFMPELERSRELALSIAEVARGAGLPTTALITAMDQPLAPVAGNALEVRHAIGFLTGPREPRQGSRLEAVTLALGAEMLVLGGLAPDLDAAVARLRAALVGGQGAERFARMVSALGGPADLVDDPDRHLPAAPVVRPVYPERAGPVAAVDGRAVGLAVVTLGGGRTRPQDAIDPTVGFTRLAAIGDEVGPDRPLALVHARDEASATRAAAALHAAYRLGEPGEARGAGLPPVVERLGEGLP